MNLSESASAAGKNHYRIGFGGLGRRITEKALEKHYSIGFEMESDITE